MLRLSWRYFLAKKTPPFYADTIENAADPRMSAVSAEVALVIGARKREQGLAAPERFFDKSGIQVIAFDSQQLSLATAAGPA